MFNDTIMRIAGTYDRTSEEAIGKIGTEGVMGAAGSTLPVQLQQELARRGLRADQLYDSSDDDNDTDGNVDRWTNDQVVAQAEEPAFSSSFAPTASGACSTA